MLLDILLAKTCIDLSVIVRKLQVERLLLEDADGRVGCQLSIAAQNRFAPLPIDQPKREPPRPIAYFT